MTASDSNYDLGINTLASTSARLAERRCTAAKIRNAHHAYSFYVLTDMEFRVPQSVQIHLLQQGELGRIAVILARKKVAD